MSTKLATDWPLVESNWQEWLEWAKAGEEPMARDEEKHENFGESMRSDTKPDSDEGLNKYYNRKQRVKKSEFGCEAEIAPPDRNAEYDHYSAERDAGPLNTPWAKERYGRS